MHMANLAAWLTLLLRCGLLVAFGLMGASVAQTLRDPTLPPAQSGFASAADAAPAEPEPMNVIVRSGKPFVVVGTRLFATGQMLGQSRIERISETEIWLRENGALRKVPRFAGIERRSVAPAGAPAPVAKVRSRAQPTRCAKHLPQVAPCVAIQPRDSSP